MGFVGYDSFTKGNWRGMYGSEVNGSGLQSPWVKLTTSGTPPSSWHWDPLDSDERALIGPNGIDRGLGQYYSPTSFEYRFEATDGRTHRLALYFVDYNGMSRSQTIEVFNTDTGELIDRRTLSNFNGGKYLIWQLRGKVTIRITNNGGTSPDAVLNAYFIDPLPPDTPVPAPDENTVGRFLGFDTSTQGNWVGAYGAEGQIIAYDTAQRFGSWAGYQRVGQSGLSASKWADPSTDVRSLQKSGDPAERIGAEFYNGGYRDVGLSFNITDGKAHRLAIYFWKRWGTPGAKYRLEIVDVNGNVVDKQLVTEMENGVYAVWRVKGRFTLWITDLVSERGEITFSGIFLDPVEGNTPSPTPRINYALTGNGGFVTSSGVGNNYWQFAAVDGHRSGVNWGTTWSSPDNGWQDNTLDAFPDWLRIDFPTAKLIDEINVFTLRDNYPIPENPTEETTFSQYGITDFDVQYWNGSVWQTVPGGNVTGNNKVWRKFTFAPISMRGIRVQVNGALGGNSRLVEVEAWSGSEPTPPPLPPPPTPTPTPTPPPPNIPPVANDDSATIDQNSIWKVIDVLANDTDPDGGTLYISNRTQGKNGSVGGNSTTVNYMPNGGFSGVDTFTYTVSDNRGGSATATVTVTVNAPVNFALAANGGVATASSSFSGAYPASAANNGDRRGSGYGGGGVWVDASPGAYPDSLEVAFNGTKTISEIGVFTVQDNFQSPAEPTATLTFSQYGNRDFEVQYWDDGAWITVPGGSVANNSNVWRRFTFAPVTTAKIRVMVTRAQFGHSQIAEVEAWGT